MFSNLGERDGPRECRGASFARACEHAPACKGIDSDQSTKDAYS